MSTSNKYDLLIRNGRVIDPANNIDRVIDVAVADGRIAAVAENIDPAAATDLIDASGLCVTPGLIDIHTHVYDTREPEGLSISADYHCLRSGVTTVADAGTAGGKHFLHFKTTVIDRATVRILAFINIVKSGMTGPFEQERREMDPELAAGTVLAYPEYCVGIKTAHYWTHQPFDETHTPWMSVDAALEAARLCDKPLMVDFYPRPERPYPELLSKMRPGDIHTHVFAQQFPILDEDQSPQTYLFEAQDRGVIFDLGHGGGSFWFRNAVPAFRGGFYPDSISTDLHTGSVNGPVFSMLNTMSKMLAIGMDFTDLIRRSTVAAAAEIGHPELGRLSVGGGADIALLEIESGEFGYWDCANTRVLADKRLSCAVTIRDGDVVYDRNGLSMPEWSETEELQ